MANVRAPNIDFTLGTPGNRPQMSAEISLATVAVVVVSHVLGSPVPQPQATTLGGGGGGGDGTYAYPICG